MADDPLLEDPSRAVEDYLHLTQVVERGIRCEIQAVPLSMSMVGPKEDVVRELAALLEQIRRERVNLWEGNDTLPLADLDLMCDRLGISEQRITALTALQTQGEQAGIIPAVYASHREGGSANSNLAPSRSCTWAGCTRHSDEESERIDQEVPLAAIDLLAPVVAMRPAALGGLDRRASAMIAPPGVGWRPPCMPRLRRRLHQGRKTDAAGDCDTIRNRTLWVNRLIETQGGISLSTRAKKKRQQQAQSRLDLARQRKLEREQRHARVALRAERMWDKTVQQLAAWGATLWEEVQGEEAVGGTSYLVVYGGVQHSFSSRSKVQRWVKRTRQQRDEQNMSWAERHVQWMIENNCDDHGNPWPE